MANGFVGHRDVTLSEQIFYVTETQSEAVIEPNSVGNNLGREAISGIGMGSCFQPGFLYYAFMSRQPDNTVARFSPTLESFSHLVLMIQEAAVGMRSWDDTVAAIVENTGGTEGILYSPCLPPSIGGFWASRSIQPRHMENYAEYYREKDVWRMKGNQYMQMAGSVFPDEAFIKISTVQDSEFYNDFLKQLDIGRLLCGIVFSNASKTMPGGLHLSLFRPLEQEGFDAQQRKFIEMLMPHLQVSMRTYFELLSHTAETALGHAALNALNTAVLIVNPEARILYANESASRMFIKTDGLITRKDVLAAATLHETLNLHAFIAGLFRSVTGLERPRIHRIERPSGRHYACFGQLLPVESPFSKVQDHPAAIIFIHDPETRTMLEPEAIAKLYDLTAAEAQLASLLVRGFNLERAAKERGISYNTARTQLKCLFLKTGCHKQAEMVSLLSGVQQI